jgi:hypothetical protein
MTASSFKPMFPDGSVVRHVRTGVEYRIFAAPDRVMIEGAGDPAYLYRKRDEPGGTLWVRVRSSMEDGRFEVVSTGSVPPSSGWNAREV